MHKVTPRVGNLPEKVRVYALPKKAQDGHMEGQIPEIYECTNPEEILDYLQEHNGVANVFQPFKNDTVEDSHFYFVATIIEEQDEIGVPTAVNKLLFAKVTPEWLKWQAAKVITKAKEARTKRWIKR